MINTREELINALYEAAELEHSLLVQYLFAAFSLKRLLSEGITGLQQAKIQDWGGIIYEVGKEEMMHLGNVCNLLSAVGAPPHFQLPSFPRKAGRYYPLIPDFSLSRFCKATLYRFICFELPQGVQPPPFTAAKEVLTTDDLSRFSAPDPLVYNRVGDLYEQIAKAFKRIPEKQLFIGPRAHQESDDWQRNFQLYAVYNRETALKAINNIVLDGEGTPGNREGSHYASFLQIWNEMEQYNFDPGRNVAENPLTRPHRDGDASGNVTYITHPTTLPVAELFNSFYNTVMLLLAQYYSFAGESAEERKMLQVMIRSMMSNILRPLGEILTELPANPHGLLKAGAGFEFYTPIQLSPLRANRWAILRERLTAHSHAAASLTSVHPRMAFIAQNTEWSLFNFKSL